MAKHQLIPQWLPVKELRKNPTMAHFTDQELLETVASLKKHDLIHVRGEGAAMEVRLNPYNPDQSPWIPNN